MIKKDVEQYKKRNTLIAGAIGVFVLAWMVFSVSFPVFRIDSNMKDDFLVRTIDGREYLELRIKGGYPFYRIVVKFNGSDVELRSVYQDELGLYANGETVRSIEQLDKFLKIEGVEVDIKNGELIQKGDFVYFVSGNKYRAFANAEVFDMLGFDWNKVQRGKSGLLSELLKGEIIDKEISYLPGSFVEVGKEIYLLGEGEKYLISKSDLVDMIKSKFGVIKVDDRKLQAIGRMKCEKSKRSDGICKLRDDSGAVLPYATVLVELEGGLGADWAAKIRTFNGFKSLVPKMTISNIKRNLLLRYDERLGINNND